MRVQLAEVAKSISMELSTQRVIDTFWKQASVTSQTRPVQNVRCELAYSYFLLTVMPLATIAEKRASFPVQCLWFTTSLAARNVVVLNVPGV